MKAAIKRIDKTIPLPQYHTKGAAAFDLTSGKEVIIPPKTVALVPLNTIIETPPDHMLVLVPRSSTPRKKNLLIPHGIGIIDQDYCGPDDVLQLQVYNFADQPVIIEKGERIAQAVFVKITKVDFEEVDEITKKTRGGFGSTG